MGHTHDFELGFLRRFRQLAFDAAPTNNLAGIRYQRYANGHRQALNLDDLVDMTNL
jgi:hypothetical protein